MCHICISAQYISSIESKVSQGLQDDSNSLAIKQLQCLCHDRVKHYDKSYNKMSSVRQLENHHAPPTSKTRQYHVPQIQTQQQHHPPERRTVVHTPTLTGSRARECTPALSPRSPPAGGEKIAPRRPLRRGPLDWTVWNGLDWTAMPCVLVVDVCVVVIYNVLSCCFVFGTVYRAIRTAASAYPALALA